MSSEYKVLIEFVYKKPVKVFNWMSHIVQNRPFIFGLRIKNIDSKNIPDGIIKKLHFKSVEGGTLLHNVEEELSFSKLNPGQEEIIWWPSPHSLPFRGSIFVSCDVISDNSNSNFFTYQWDRNCKRASKFHPDRWGEALSVRGELEQQQATTNMYMFVLTCLVFLDGVWGLNNIANMIVNFTLRIFISIGNFLISLSS
ncbi:MAG: hypothetical protein HGA25_10830 [Clostridiales bacterium]|nr:hypothetical protein [Clostridiales bacterium]